MDRGSTLIERLVVVTINVVLPALLSAAAGQLGLSGQGPGVRLRNRDGRSVEDRFGVASENRP